MVWIKSYFHVNINVKVKISCVNWNNLGIINCIKILTAKSNSIGLKSLQTKFQLLPPHKDERKHSVFVTSPSTEKRLSW